MAAYTASVTGNWADTATWGGSGPPGNGDTVTINDGITVTIPVSTTVTIGASPDDDISTPAIQPASSSGTGILIVNGTLIFRGSVRQADADWTLGPGAILEHDSSLATTPSSTNYTWQIGMAAGQTNNLVANGATGAGRVICRNAASSGKCGGFTGGSLYTGAGGVDFEFVSITGWRAAGGNNEVIMTNMTLSTSKQRLVDCLLDDCGPIGTTRSNTHVEAHLELLRTSHLNPSDAYCYEGWQSSNADKTTGTRDMKYCIFDGALEIVYCRDMDFTGTAVWGNSGVKAIDGEGGTRFECSAWTDALIGSSNNLTNRMISGAEITGVLVHRSNEAGERDFMRGGAGNSSPINAYKDCVLVSEGTTVTGEWFIFEGNPSVATTGVVTGCLELPVENGNGAGGKLVTNISSSANYTFTVDNNTVVVDHATNGDDPVIFQSQIEGVAGQVESVRNNFVYNSSGTDRTGLVTFENIPAAIADMITNASNNGSYGISGSLYDHADSKFLNSPPGADDVDADPQYVDDSITLTSWASSIDPTLTTLDLWWEEAKKMNDDSGYDPDLHWMEFYTAARAGFTPQNTALQGAGYDGSDIGAIAVTVSAAIRKNNSGMLRRVGRVNQLG
jgi:hypothetical protein